MFCKTEVRNANMRRSITFFSDRDVGAGGERKVFRGTVEREKGTVGVRPGVRPNSILVGQFYNSEGVGDGRGRGEHRM